MAAPLRHGRFRLDVAPRLLAFGVRDAWDEGDAAGACRDTSAPMPVRVRPFRHRAGHPSGASRARSRRATRSDPGAPALAYVDLAARAPNRGRPRRAADHAVARGAPPLVTQGGRRLSLKGPNRAGNRPG